MKVTWCKELADLVNMARGQGWIFHLERRGRHYYYVYAGMQTELMCVVAEVKEPVKAKYVTINDEGKLVSSDSPIMPACARITEVLKDEAFEELIGG